MYQHGTKMYLPTSKIDVGVVKTIPLMYTSVSGEAYPGLSVASRGY